MFLQFPLLNLTSVPFSLETTTEKIWRKVERQVPACNTLSKIMYMIALTALSSINSAYEFAAVTVKFTPALAKFGFENTPLIKKLGMGAYISESLNIEHVHNHLYRAGNFAVAALLFPTFGVLKTDGMVKHYRRFFVVPRSLHQKAWILCRQSLQAVTSKANRNPRLLKSASVATLAISFIALIGIGYNRGFFDLWSMKRVQIGSNRENGEPISNVNSDLEKIKTQLLFYEKKLKESRKENESWAALYIETVDSSNRSYQERERTWEWVMGSSFLVHLALHALLYLDLKRKAVTYGGLTENLKNLKTEIQQRSQKS